MGKSDLILELMSFGLTSSQAEVYLTLLQLGGAKASEIANKANIERTQVHHILSKLHKLGLVQTSLSRPTVWLPVPIKMGLNNLLQLKEDTLRSLKLKVEDLARKLEATLSRSISVNPGPCFKLIFNQKQILDQLENSFFKNLSNRLAIMMSINDLYELILRRSIIEDLKRMAREGTKILTITNVHSGEDLEDLAELMKIASIRCIDIPDISFVMSYNEVLMFYPIKRESPSGVEEPMGLWLSGKLFNMAFNSLFDTLWSYAFDINLVYSLLKEGRPVHRLKVIETLR